MKQYFLCSSEVVKIFPNLVRSNPFNGNKQRSETHFVIETEDDTEIVNYYDGVVAPHNNKTEISEEYKPIDFWFYPICISSLPSKGIERITIKDCKILGLFFAIEWAMSFSKMENVAFAIYLLSEKYSCSPIQFANKI